MSGYGRRGRHDEEREAVVPETVEEEAVVGPQALLDEHVYVTPVSTDLRVTHVAMTEEEEIAAAAAAETPPDTTEGGLSRESRNDYNRG